MVLSLQDCGVGKDDLTQIELQICVDFVNTVVQEEHDCKQNIIFSPRSGNKNYLLSLSVETQSSNSSYFFKRDVV